MPRRFRKILAVLTCPRCGEARIVRLQPPMRALVAGMPDHRELLRLDCDSRVRQSGRTVTHCGGPLILTAGDVRRAFSRLRAA